MPIQLSTKSIKKIAENPVSQKLGGIRGGNQIYLQEWPSERIVSCSQTLQCIDLSGFMGLWGHSEQHCNPPIVTCESSSTDEVYPALAS